MAMEVLGNWSHWVTADGSGELCPGGVGALGAADGGTWQAKAQSCCSSRGDDKPVEEKRFDLGTDEYSKCCNAFSCVLDWDEA